MPGQKRRQARELTAAPEPYATAELLATGERASAALLGIALDRSGVPSRVLNPREVSLTVAGSPLDSELIAVDVEHLRSLLGELPVLMVPGFFGTDVAGRTHVLGRGGSDLLAVFLALAEAVLAATGLNLRAQQAFWYGLATDLEVVAEESTRLLEKDRAARLKHVLAAAQADIARYLGILSANLSS